MAKKDKAPAPPPIPSAGPKEGEEEAPPAPASHPWGLDEKTGIVYDYSHRRHKSK